MHNISSTYTVVFKSGRSTKPRTAEYTEFKEKWGFIDTLYQAADAQGKKVEEIYQDYLSDFLQYLSWCIEKNKAEEAQEKYDEQLRQAKRGRR